MRNALLLIKLHRWLDKDDTVRFFFMLLVVALFMVPIQSVKYVHHNLPMLVLMLSMLVAGLYIAMTRVIYIQGISRG